MKSPGTTNNFVDTYGRVIRDGQQVAQLDEHEIAFLVEPEIMAERKRRAAERTFAEDEGARSE